MTPTAYRRDIDGLRGIAVAAVVLFHAFPRALPGGFVGVDVFFVISGFLITGIVAAEVGDGRFSFSRFYGRRARRLFPALVIALLATFALSWWLDLASEFAATGAHMAAAAGFGANLLFMSEAGYFEVASIHKPLLHLWSLGVEEQFYLCWPAILALSLHFRRSGLTSILLILLSLAWAVVYGPENPGSFFDPLCRIWELLAGAALVLTLRNGTSNEVAAIVGAVLVAAALLVDPGARLPLNSSAVMATAGTLLLISAPQSRINRFILASRPLVWLGLISYPLYLFHWPIFAFRNLIAGGSPTLTFGFAAIVVSVSLAAAVYRWVERPIRMSRRPAATWGPVAGLAACGVAGIAAVLSGGFPSRVMASNMDVATAKIGADRSMTTPGCLAPEPTLFRFCAHESGSAPTFAVWGDSKGDALFWGLARVNHRAHGQAWMLIGNSACPPSVEQTGKSDCDKGNAQALAILLASNVRAVVLASSARSFSGPRSAETGISEAASALLAGGKSVVFVIDNPVVTEPNEEPVACARRLDALARAVFGNPHPCSLTYQEHMRRTAGYRQAVGRIAAKNPTLVVFDTTPLLCDRAKNTCPIAINGRFLYSYSDHISDVANGMLAEKLLPLVHALPTPRQAPGL